MPLHLVAAMRDRNHSFCQLEVFALFPYNVPFRFERGEFYENPYCAPNYPVRG
jgi:hypothetical protein